MQRLERLAPPDMGFKLAQPTIREREVLTCFGLGMSNKQVAERLGITPATVRNHAHNAFSSLGVSDRTQAVIVGLKKGFISAETLTEEFDFSLFRCLTGAEKRVLDFAIQGEQGVTNKEIGNNLGRSESTIRQTLARIYSQFDIHDKTRVAVLYWLYRTMTREQIEKTFPSQEEVFGEEEVKALVSRNPEEIIVFVVPGSTKVIKQGEQQKDQAAV
ncbi:MAG: LuxR C-terminal-related transcriptional regulator [bacterium]|nr:LuxR C-terminal-related transcriptional regulator [bacterium]